jgi:hypothetical protein
VSASVNFGGCFPAAISKCAGQILLLVFPALLGHGARTAFPFGSELEWISCRPGPICLRGLSQDPFLVQISCPHWDFGSALIPTRAQLGLWAQLKIFYQPTLFCSGFVFPPHQGSVFLAASGDRSRSLFGGVTRVRSTESFFSLKP